MNTDHVTTSYGVISCDDHVVEPPKLWFDRLPASSREVAPRVERRRIVNKPNLSWEYSDEGEWADVWRYEDVHMPYFMAMACAGVNKKEILPKPVLYDEMRPGSYDPVARLADLDINGMHASLCFPNMFVRFCGQTFLEASDKALALQCVLAYNDWIVDEWSAGSSGRLVPLCIVPMWDPQLAAQEVYRNAARGVSQVSFSELPHYLGLPSLHSDHWDPFVLACAETDTVINVHIGSGSKFFSTSDDAPSGVTTMLTFVGPVMALADWLLSGYLLRYPNLNVALAETNIGWLPFVLERADNRWAEDRGFQPEWRQFKEPPSWYFRNNMFCSFFNDTAGLAHIAKVGVMNNFSFDNLTFETDYPHSDTTFPNSLQVAAGMMKDLSDGDRRKLLHDNAARQLRIPVGAVPV